MNAVQPLEQWHRLDVLRRLAVGLLNIATDEQVEGLVGATELEVGLDRDGVVRLQERIEQFVQPDRSPLLGALGEVLPRQHPGHGVAAVQLDDVRETHRVKPLRLIADLGVALVENLPGLVEVGAGGCVHLVLRQLRSSHVLAGGITYPSRPVADDQHRLVSLLLIAAERPEDHGVAEVDVGPGRVEAQLDAQPVAAFDPALQMLAVDDLDGAGGNRIPGAVIKVLSFLHRSVTRSRRRVYTRLTRFTVLF